MKKIFLKGILFTVIFWSISHLIYAQVTFTVNKLYMTGKDCGYTNFLYSQGQSIPAPSMEDCQTLKMIMENSMNQYNAEMRALGASCRVVIECSCSGSNPNNWGGTNQGNQSGNTGNLNFNGPQQGKPFTSSNPYYDTPNGIDDKNLYDKLLGPDDRSDISIPEAETGRNNGANKAFSDLAQDGIPLNSYTPVLPYEKPVLPSLIPQGGLTPAGKRPAPQGQADRPDSDRDGNEGKSEDDSSGKWSEKAKDWLKDKAQDNFLGLFGTSEKTNDNLKYMANDVTEFNKGIIDNARNLIKGEWSQERINDYFHNWYNSTSKFQEKTFEQGSK